MNVYKGVIVQVKPLGAGRHILTLSRDEGPPLLLRVRDAALLELCHDRDPQRMVGCLAQTQDRLLRLTWPAGYGTFCRLSWAPILARRVAPDLASLQRRVILVPPRSTP